MSSYNNIPQSRYRNSGMGSVNRKCSNDHCIVNTISGDMLNYIKTMNKIK